MQTTHCDICGHLIKNNSVKYAMVVQKIVQGQRPPENQHEAMQMEEAMREEYRVKLKEICETCKQIHEYIFKLRKDNVDRIKKELEKSYEKVKKTRKKVFIDAYCNCEEFIDEGIAIQGIADGICYACGKYERPLFPDDLKKLIDTEENDEKI